MDQNRQRLHAHLTQKSSDDLITIIFELLNEVSETTRQTFWQQIAPEGMATADLVYPSAEDFLQELASFAQDVREGDYYDEEAAEQFEDSDPYQDDYGNWVEDEYDFELHTGVQELKRYIEATNSYFKAGQMQVAATAYGEILYLCREDMEELMGVSSPLLEIGQREHELTVHYFEALKATESAETFYDKAYQLIARHRWQQSLYLEKLEPLIENKDDIRRYLEGWAANMTQQTAHHIRGQWPFQLQKLFDLYKHSGQTHKSLATKHALRFHWLMLFQELIEAYMKQSAWQKVIAYGDEVLPFLAKSSRPAYLIQPPGPDSKYIRTQLAIAHEALGQYNTALAIYQPIYENAPNFETFVVMRRLSSNVNTEKARSFQARTIAYLEANQPQQRTFLTQIYLVENQFDAAFDLIKHTRPYSALDAFKLVAKAHLIGALGSHSDAKMGRLLKELYGKMMQGSNSATLLLRDYLPAEASVAAPVAIARAEQLYRKLVQAHIDNGRKTYATAAYYCALLREIAVYTGHEPAFWKYYRDLLKRYPRHRALRREMEQAVGTL